MAWGGTPVGALLPAPEPLFPRIDKEAWIAEAEAATAAGGDATVEETTVSEETKPAGAPEPAAAEPAATETATAGGQIDVGRFFETQLRVGTVKHAEPVPKSNKLLRLEVDLGEGAPRQLVAGIAKAYEPEALVGRQVVVVANLEPATLMGVESRGMVLAASEDGQPVLLRPDREVPPGTQVR
jgi:methionyl-tRNA synthetase